MSDTNDNLQARAERTPCPLDWPCERSDLVDALCKALADATDRVETLERGMDQMMLADTERWTEMCRATEKASHYYLLTSPELPEIVTQLGKERDDFKRRAELAEADNAALREEMQEWYEEGGVVDTARLAFILSTANHGAALLARHKRLEAVAEAAKALIDDLDVCGCTKGCGGYFGNVDEHPTAGRERFDALRDALETRDD